MLKVSEADKTLAFAFAETDDAARAAAHGEKYVVDLVTALDDGILHPQLASAYVGGELRWISDIVDLDAIAARLDGQVRITIGSELGVR